MDKIWLKYYQNGVPAEISPDQYASLLDMFKESVQRFDGHPALANFGVTLTYQQWDNYSRYFAAYLQQKLGCKKGERIAVMLPNCFQYPIVIFGAMMAGLTVVNVNPLYTTHELIHQINDSQATRLVVIANVAHTVEVALPELQLKSIIITELGDLFPFPKSFLMNFLIKYIARKVPRYTLPNSISFRRMMKQGKDLPFEPVTLTGDDIAFLQYTGGTTGIAKGAILSQRNMVSNVEQAVAWIAPVMEEDKEIMITPLPL